MGTMRSQYASSMRDLATNHWENSNDSEVKTSRIDWVRKNVCQYFYGDENWELISNVKTHLIESSSSSSAVASLPGRPNDSTSFKVVAERSGLFAAVCKDIRRDMFDAGRLKKDSESGRPLLSGEDAARVSSDGVVRWRRCLTSVRADSARIDHSILG